MGNARKKTYFWQEKGPDELCLNIRPNQVVQKYSYILEVQFQKYFWPYSKSVLEGMSITYFEGFDIYFFLGNISKHLLVESILKFVQAILVIILLFTIFLLSRMSKT